MTIQPLTKLSPRFRNGLLEIPVAVMRGGTSTGVVLDEADMPESQSLREELLRAVMGVPEAGLVTELELEKNKQITGFGRGVPTSNKCFIVSQSERSDADIDSTLAQLANDSTQIDWRVNCGNFSSALPLYAAERGWLGFENSGANVRIWNTNTQLKLEGQVSLKNGQYDTLSIDGVMGEFPKIVLTLFDPVGSKTGELLPSGSVLDDVDGVRCSLVDVGVPMVIIDASDLSLELDDLQSQFDSEPSLYKRFQMVWQTAALKLGLKNASGELMTLGEISHSETMPKVCLVAKPTRPDAHIRVCYYTPQKLHNSVAVSGGTCIAATCLIEGAVTDQYLSSRPLVKNQQCQVTIQHPAGIMNVYFTWAGETCDIANCISAGYERNAQLMSYAHMPIYSASESLLEHYKSSDC